MPFRIVSTLFLTFLVIAANTATGGWDPDADSNLSAEARETVRLFRQKDPSMSKFFSAAEGWAVYPTVGKAGFWIGGAYGEGVVYQRGRRIGYTELKQVSIGLQFGGQAYREIIFFKDKAALDRFKAEKLEFDAQLSAVVADKGAAANADYHDGVAVFTMTKGGLMAEASVGGQSFSFKPAGN